MIRRSARNDPSAGCITPTCNATFGEKKLGDIIDKVLRHDKAQEAQQKPLGGDQKPWEGVDSQTAYIRGYTDALLKTDMKYFSKTVKEMLDKL